MEMEFRLYSNMDKGRDRGKVKLELCLQSNTAAVMTGFTPEVTLRKSRVEGGWDLASPYVVCPCLHAQWFHISGLVGGGDKDLSRGVNKPVRAGLSRLSE